MKNKKWIFSRQDSARVDTLTREIPLMRLTARVLAARGVETITDARQFLNKSPSSVHDPFLLTDMDKAVLHIESAVEAGTKIAIYGDYDVDGVTATCILIKYLKNRGAECMYYIPDRLGEGYGLNTAAIKSLYEQGCRLLITVDSGITATDEVEFANSLGMSVIVTDHHECKEKLPDAVAVINPRRDGSRYPFRELAGVGVAFKLICALERGREVEQLLDEYSDIVAVGTIADVMPLSGENRVIVSWGLKCLKNTRNPGLRALMQKLGLTTKPITSNSVSFIMAPRINAAGRLGGASVAAEMFLTDDAADASELADDLCELNRRRQEEENEIFEQVTARLRAEPHLTQGKTLTLWGDNWHNGVIGIVSSRLSDRYGMPCVLISMSGDSGKGSGRSVQGFNLYAALEKSAHLLEKCGGHELAVGFTVDRSNLEALAEALEQYALDEEAPDADSAPSVLIDCEVEPNELTLAEIAGFSELEPFGMGNPQPALFMRDVCVEEITPISNDRHIKLLLTKGERRFYAFAFGMGAKNCLYENGDRVDVVFSAEINNYKGRQSIQLIVRDIRWAESEIEADRAAVAVYDEYHAGGALSPDMARMLSPTKDELRAVFRYIKTNCENGSLNVDLRSIYRKVRYSSKTSINIGRFLVCLDVFNESNIFTYTRFGDEVYITCNDIVGKASISGSKILKQLIDLVKGEI